MVPDKLVASLVCALLAACGYLGGCGGDDGDGDNSPLLPEEIVRAAVVMGSCIPDDGIEDAVQELWSTDARITDVFENPNAVVRCVATRGGGCDAVQSCLSFTIDFGGPCERGCSGNVYTGCDDSLRTRIDCSKLGLRCDPELTCVGDEPVERCDWDTYVGSCEDGRPLFCGGRVDRGPVCADHGLECAESSDYEGEFVCRGTGEDCHPWESGPSFIEGDGIACTGDTLETCVNGGMSERDCAALHPGWGCYEAYDEEARGAEFFCGLGDECTDDGQVECEGDEVVFCNMGRLDRLDCTSFGFTGCGAPYGCTPTPWQSED